MTDPDVAGRIVDMTQARGAEYERTVEARRERERARKLEARRRLTPEQRERERSRKHKARTMQTPIGRENARPCAPRPHVDADKGLLHLLPVLLLGHNVSQTGYPAQDGPHSGAETAIDFDGPAPL